MMAGKKEDSNTNSHSNPSSPPVMSPLTTKLRNARNVLATKRKRSQDGPTPAKRVRSEASSEIACPVCLETAAEIEARGVRIIKTRCKHSFCRTCTRDWIKTKKAKDVKCPMCRKDLKVYGFPRLAQV